MLCGEPLRQLHGKEPWRAKDSLRRGAALGTSSDAITEANALAGVTVRSERACSTPASRSAALVTKADVETPSNSAARLSTSRSRVEMRALAT